MYDLHRVGGTPAVLKALLDAGFLHGDCITVTGKTLAENLQGRAEHLQRASRTSSSRSTSRCTPTGHIVILKGNLAPDGAVAKVAGLKKRKITGPAKVFDGEEACFAAIQERQIKPGDVVVDPRRRPGRRARHARDAVGHGGAGRARGWASRSA